MKSNMQIVDVIPITQTNQRHVDVLKQSPDFEANSGAIAQLRESVGRTVVQLDEGVSLTPYNDGLELSLYMPAVSQNPHQILGIYSAVIPENGQFKRIPQRLLIGREAQFVIVIESDCHCCREKHALIIDADGQKPVAFKKYSPLENINVGHDFEIAFSGNQFDLSGKITQDVLTKLARLQPQRAPDVRQLMAARP